jgi:hypothetical protein
MEDVVSGNLDPVTSDFWFSRLDTGYHIRKLVADVTEPLNDLDYEILDTFAVAHPVSIVYFSESSRAFNEFRHVKGMRYARLNSQGKSMAPVVQSYRIEDSYCDKQRIDKACLYLEERQQLKNAAIRRIFANCWLGRNVWDVDTFTMTSKKQIVALEVKHKYPARNNTFGLNDGQKDLFNFLLKEDIPVIHVILKKPENKPELHAIDLLTFPAYTGRTQWLFTRFFNEKLKPAASVAPRHTSIHGAVGIRYSEISTEQFEVLKKFGVTVPDVRKKLLAGLE